MRYLLVLAAIGLLAYAAVTGGGNVPSVPQTPTSATFTGRPGPTGTDNPDNACAWLIARHPGASCHVINQDGP